MLLRETSFRGLYFPNTLPWLLFIGLPFFPHRRPAGRSGVGSGRAHVQREQRADAGGEPCRRQPGGHLRRGPPVARPGGQEERAGTSSLM